MYRRTRCLVTGATSGIGRATATELGRLGWDLWLVGRNQRRGRGLVRAIDRTGTGASARFERVDVSNLKEVEALAERLRAEADRLDVLINDAGARFMELGRRWAEDGVAVNAVDPGGVATRSSRNNGLLAWIRHCAFYVKERSLLTARQACQTVVWLASAKEVSGVTGKCFSEQREIAPSAYAQDRALAGKLWELSERLSGRAG